MLSDWIFFRQLFVLSCGPNFVRLTHRNGSGRGNCADGQGFCFFFSEFANSLQTTASLHNNGGEQMKVTLRKRVYECFARVFFFCYSLIEFIKQIW